MGKSKRHSVYKEIQARKQKAALKEFDGILSGKKIIPEIVFYDDLDDEVPNYNDGLSRCIANEEPAKATWATPPVRNEPATRGASSEENISAVYETHTVVEIDASIDADVPLDELRDKDASDTSPSPPDLDRASPNTPAVQNNTDDASQRDTTYSDATRQDDSSQDVPSQDVPSQGDPDKGSSDEDELNDISSSEDTNEYMRMEIQYPLDLESKLDLPAPASSDTAISIPNEDYNCSGETTPELSPTKVQQPDWPVQSSLFRQNNTRDNLAEKASNVKAPAYEWQRACHAELPYFDPCAFFVKRTGHIKARPPAKVKRIPGVKGNYSLSIPFDSDKVPDYETTLDLDEIMVSTFSEGEFNSKDNYIFHKDGNPLNHSFDNLHVCNLDELQKLEINLQQELHPGVKYAVARRASNWNGDLSKYLVSTARMVYSLVGRTHLKSFKNGFGQESVCFTVLSVDNTPKKLNVSMDELITNSFNLSPPPTQGPSKSVGKQAYLPSPNPSASPDLAENSLTQFNGYDYQPNSSDVYPSAYDSCQPYRTPDSMSTSTVITQPTPRSREYTTISQQSSGIIHFIPNGEELMRRQHEELLRMPGLQDQEPSTDDGRDALGIQFQSQRAILSNHRNMTAQNGYGSRKTETCSSGETSPFAKVDGYDPFITTQEDARGYGSNSPVITNRLSLRTGNDIFDTNLNTIVHHMPKSQRIFSWVDQETVIREAQMNLQGVFGTPAYNVTMSEPISTPTISSTEDNKNNTLYQQQDAAACAMWEDRREIPCTQPTPLEQYIPAAKSTFDKGQDEKAHNIQNTAIISTEPQSYKKYNSQNADEQQHDMDEMVKKIQPNPKSTYDDRDTTPVQQPDVPGHIVQKGQPDLEENQKYAVQILHDDQAALEEQREVIEHNTREYQPDSQDKECIMVQDIQEGEKIASGKQQGDAIHKIPENQKTLPQEIRNTTMEKVRKERDVVTEEPQSSVTNNPTITKAPTEPTCTVSAAEGIVKEIQWRPIGKLPWSGLSYSGYEVSESGDVRKIGSSTTLELKFTNGHPIVRLECDTESSAKQPTKAQVAVSRIVAKAFVEGYSEVRCFVRHRNRNPQDISAQNLEWVDRKGLRVGRGSRTVVATLVSDSNDQKRFPSLRQAELALSIAIKGVAPNGSIEKMVEWDGKKQLALIQVLD
ncbi:hypothetical protein BJV82DRAFT_715076 [Fennellomyces sp. T-0311]|nr:hypothetical protein BJV82DRAFT_715076 [Fennellomyces sp. T-0311]